MTTAAARKPRRPKTRPPEQVTLQHRRYYQLADGTKLPSVTTILGVALNKPALPGWAAKTVATEAMDNLPRLVRMSRTDRDGALRWLKGSPYAQRDAAAEAGTQAHQLAEAHALGKPYTKPDPGTDLGKTLEHFLAWIADFTPRSRRPRRSSSTGPSATPGHSTRSCGSPPSTTG